VTAATLPARCNCVPLAVEKTLHKLQEGMAKYGARVKSGEADAAEPTGASKPYKPPPKPEARAPTVPKAPGAARAKASDPEPRVPGSRRDGGVGGGGQRGGGAASAELMAELQEKDANARRDDVERSPRVNY